MTWHWNVQFWRLHGSRKKNTPKLNGFFDRPFNNTHDHTSDEWLILHAKFTHPFEPNQTAMANFCTANSWKSHIENEFWGKRSWSTFFKNLTSFRFPFFSELNKSFHKIQPRYCILTIVRNIGSIQMVIIMFFIHKM